MLKLHKSKFRDLYTEKITKESIKLIKEESREASQLWTSEINKFPEKMYSVFNEFLKTKSEEQGEIVFFDIGAAEGCYSCDIIKHFQKGTIVSFEPEFPRLEVFIENLTNYMDRFNRKQDNFDIQIYERLVTSGEEETATMRYFICEKTGGGGGSGSVVKFDRPERICVDVEYESVKLDDFVDDYESVDIIKIDVEGAEVEVLKGARQFFNKFKPVVFLEIHSSPQNGLVTLDQVKKVFDTYNTQYEFDCIEAHSISGRPLLSYYLIKEKK
jgi:FkbM family methyltransferase